MNQEERWKTDPRNDVRMSMENGNYLTYISLKKNNYISVITFKLLSINAFCMS